MLEQDRQAPRQQRPTAHRIYLRLRTEYPPYPISERWGRQSVRARKAELGLLGQTVCIPQRYDWGVEGQVDWYEAMVELAGERQLAPVFVVRSMASRLALSSCLSPRDAASVSRRASARLSLFWWGVSAAAL